MTRLVLRVVATAVALAGLVDPAWAVRRNRPLRLEVLADTTPESAATRDRLLALVGAIVQTSSGEVPDAVVLIGNKPIDSAPEGVPISFVSLSPRAAGIRLLDASLPEFVLAGQEAVVTATIEGSGIAGRTSAIVLEQDGIALSRIEHRWSSSLERFNAELRLTPPSSGATAVRVAAYLDGTALVPDGAADLLLNVRARSVRALVYEPRPSWMAGFVRRALESDRAFAAVARARFSRGVGVSTEQAPQRMTEEALKSFEVAIIGAPEELTAGELVALEGFVRARGGSAVFLADRRPAGPYRRLLPSERFDEVLLDRPAPIDVGGSLSLRAAELSIAGESSGGAAPIGTVTLSGSPKPVIVSWPLGAGRMVFSGALDAWRYRAADDEAFARFWKGTVGSLGLAAPPNVAVRIEPAIAAPGERVVVRAAVRPTELVRDGADRVAPPIDASITAPDGSARMLRLWPGAETGVFTTSFRAPAPGRYDLRVAIAGASTDAPFVVDRSARHPRSIGDDLRRYIAEATGGTIVSASDLEPLGRHLRSIGRDQAIEQAHPLRSGWWLLVFTAALTGEWTLRRRSGSR
jgi:hypothetical protein